jgi:hypothetical protein
LDAFYVGLEAPDRQSPNGAPKRPAGCGMVSESRDVVVNIPGSTTLALHIVNDIASSAFLRVFSLST